MNIVVYGAGKIGRGLLGQIVAESGHQALFIDIIPELVQALNHRRTYLLALVTNEERQERTIPAQGAIHGRDLDAVAAAIDRADLMAISVGVRNLGDIASFLAAGIARRAQRNGPPLNILICENLKNAPQTLGQMIEPHLASAALDYMRRQVGLVDAVIGRAVPEVPAAIRQRDPSYILTEPFGALHLNQRALVAPLPFLANVHLHDQIQAYVDRKLYLHNCGHAVLAYVGALRGITHVHAAIADPHTAAIMAAAWAESRQALQAEHDFDPAALRAYCDELTHRFGNRALSDTLERVGRDPIRKLGHADRLVGPARLCLQHQIKPDALAWAIGAALLFAPPADQRAQELQQMIRDRGLNAVLQAVCEIDSSGQLAQMIQSRYAALQRHEMPTL